MVITLLSLPVYKCRRDLPQLISCPLRDYLVLPQMHERAGTEGGCCRGSLCC